MSSGKRHKAIEPHANANGLRSDRLIITPLRRSFPFYPAHVRIIITTRMIVMIMTNNHIISENIVLILFE